MQNILKKLQYIILVAILSININILFNSPLSAKETPKFNWTEGIGCPAHCGLGGDWFSCEGGGTTCYSEATCLCYVKP